jgi:hypothetical protein
VAFENTRCLSCGSALGYSVTAGRVVVLLDVGGAPGHLPPARDGVMPPVERRCANAGLAACHWLAGEDVPSGLCLCCRLTRTRPRDDDVEALAAFAKTEAAKRRLVYQLLDLRLPVVPRADGGDLAFDLLSSRDEPVTTGHADGVITLDLAEGDDSHREAVRAELHEPYRTVLGHLRHEIGHYYWQQLVGEPPRLDAFRALFGDERADYAEAVRRHYAGGPPEGRGEQYVSAYATMHPWEDWAETFAHYLHLRDMLQTAHAYGLSVHGDPADDPAADPRSPGAGIEDIVAEWLPLSYGLNAVNRSLGKDDLYPFVLTPAVVAKLGAVHAAVLARTAAVGPDPFTRSAGTLPPTG